MHDRYPVAPIEESLAREIFERNIRNSRDVIAGEFENVLADIIEQLSSPPVHHGHMVSASDMTKRIARAMREGFAGLPPNGFDFCTWLWGVAPLHDVQIPQANEIGTSRGFSYGVIHLRKIAVMVAEGYVEEQPQKVQSLVPLIDSSIGWVDARNLIIYGLLDYYTRFFEQEYAALLEEVHEQRRWRRLIPLAVAARMIVVDPGWTGMSLALVAAAFRSLDEENVHRAVAFALRAAAMYGDQAAFAAFIASQGREAAPQVRGMLCEAVRLSKYDWEESFVFRVRPVLEGWAETPDDAIRQGAERALHVLAR